MDSLSGESYQGRGSAEQRAALDIDCRAGHVFIFDQEENRVGDFLRLSGTRYRQVLSGTLPGLVTPWMVCQTP